MSLPDKQMPSYLRAYYECPFRTMGDFGYSDVLYFKKPDISLSCNHLIDASLRGEVDRDFKRHSFTANESRCIDPHPMACDSSPSPPVLYSSPSFSEGGTSMNQPIGKLDRRRGPLVDTETLHRSKRGIYNSSPGHQIVVPAEGMYLVILKISVDSTSSSFFDAQVELEMKTPFGYLSAVEHPLLIFYGVMSLVYVAFAIGWTIVSALQWRDLLRIQFWIGAVILLGMLEKAVFYAEHSSVNSRGVSVEGAVLFAEFLSCLKRTLARMLVIIVSLGFGIIKPRLGSMFHRVISIGILYFALSAIECVLRLYRPKNDPTNQAMMAGVPLAVLDSIICYWVYNSLVQTTRTLNLRRNLVKLSLYTKFTNTLIAAVISSMAFMIWEIHTHKLTSCLIDWQRLWIDEAFWHIQFSIVLLVIMILWRPTKNNQRYAFTQLLDGVDEDTESGELFNKDLYDGMTLRQQHNNHIDSDDASVKSRDLLLSRETEEDLKWVEQNIVSSFAES